MNGGVGGVFQRVLQQVRQAAQPPAEPRLPRLGGEDAKAVQDALKLKAKQANGVPEAGDLPFAQELDAQDYHFKHLAENLEALPDGARAGAEKAWQAILDSGLSDAEKQDALTQLSKYIGQAADGGDTHSRQLSEGFRQGLDALGDFVDAQAMGEFAGMKDELLAGMIANLAGAGIDQGGDATCAVASAERQLIANDPRGYVEMMRDLVTSPLGAASPDGEVGLLTPSPQDVRAGGVDGRSLASSLFQQSVLQTMGTKPGATPTAEELGKVLPHLNGRDPQAMVMVGPADQAKLMEALLVRAPAVALVGSGAGAHALTIWGSGLDEQGQKVTYVLDPENPDPNHPIPIPTAELQKTLVGGMADEAVLREAKVPNSGNWKTPIGSDQMVEATAPVVFAYLRGKRG